MSSVKCEASSSPPSEDEGDKTSQSSSPATNQNNASIPPTTNQTYAIRQPPQDNRQSEYPPFQDMNQPLDHHNLNQGHGTANQTGDQPEQPQKMQNMQYINLQHHRFQQNMQAQFPQPPVPLPQPQNPWNNHPALENNSLLQQLAAQAPANLTPQNYESTILQRMTGGIHPSLSQNDGQTSSYQPILPRHSPFTDLAEALRPQKPSQSPQQAPVNRQQRQRAPPIRRARGNVQCAACHADFGARQTVQTLCEPTPHHYCHPCYKPWLQNAIITKTLCVCCDITSPFDLTKLYFTAPLSGTDIGKEYRDLQEELSTPNPQYCANSTCEHFIKPRAVHPDKGYRSCTACGKRSCTKCDKLLQDHLGNRGEVCPAHVSSISLEATSAQLEEAFPGETWRRCPRCLATHFRQSEGCNQLRCPLCGQWFCFACGETRVPSAVCSCHRVSAGAE